ncbi:MAG: efflux RND transporter permease subunit [Rhodobacteraceae bacterium]|nr:efflux RND transporter permease subunit [Paracoccaceae bacterium]
MAAGRDHARREAAGGEAGGREAGGQAPPRANPVLAYFTRHGTAAHLVLVLMVVAGLAVLPGMQAQYFPDVVIEDVSVSVAWPGAGAEDIDTTVVQVVEPAILAVEGVEGTTARATAGRGLVVASFGPGADMDRAEKDVRAAVEALRNLPASAEAPVVSRGVWRDRVTDVAIHGPVSVDQLGRFADELVQRLFQAGVTRTTIQGFAAPLIRVEVGSDALIGNDIGMAEIAAAIAAETAAAPAGDVAGGAARVLTGSPRRTAGEIAAIVLRSRPDGSALTVGEIAAVTEEGIDRDRALFVGPDPALLVRVDRENGGDAIALQATVGEVARSLQATLPAGVKVELVRTRAEMITDRLALLLDNGIAGFVLVLVLLFLFLDARTALWVAAGIPVAMLAGIAAMWALGMTFNMMSLFALILTLGIVVDDAIVVGEHADHRHRVLGEAPAVAAENAATVMAAPVVAAALTTIIAFFGLVAIGGHFGELIRDIPLTVNAVLLASLVECFLILPAHMRHALAHARAARWYDWPNRVVNRGFDRFRTALFRPLVGAVIRARYPVIAGALALLTGQVALVIRGDVPWRFFDSPEQGSITGNFAMLPGATRADSLAMLRELQRATDAVAARLAARHGASPVAFVLAELGGNSGRGLPSAETKDADLLGAISIELIDPDLRPYSSFAFLAELQEEVHPHPLAEEVSFRGGRTGPGGDALSVRVAGADGATLKAAAEAIKARLAVYPEVSGLEDNLAYDKEELVLTLTPQGQTLGFRVDALGRLLRERLNGIEAARFPDGPRTASVRVELARGELTADFLDRMLMRAPSGNYLPLADIVTVSRRQGFAAIRRENGLRLVTVTGDVAGDDPARAAAITEHLRAGILPGIEADFGVRTELAGLAEQERAFLSDALTGLVLCLLGIYLTLAWVFASWTRPLVVMAVIPFGLVGAIWGHALWDTALSLFSAVGIIGMAGIIINDAIVLVAAVDQHPKDRGLVPAIVDAAADRLRPVLLTTLTTVLGLAPLLYESSSQALFLKPTVIALAYGLGFGMVLVVALVPAMLAVQADLGRVRRALRRAFRGRAGLRGAMALAALALAALGAATVGAVAVTGRLPAALAETVGRHFPGLAGTGPGALALALFAAGAAAILLAVYALLALGLLRAAARRRRRVL